MENLQNNNEDLSLLDTLTDYHGSNYYCFLPEEKMSVSRDEGFFNLGLGNSLSIDKVWRKNSDSSQPYLLAAVLCHNYNDGYSYAMVFNSFEEALSSMIEEASLR